MPGVPDSQLYTCGFGTPREVLDARHVWAQMCPCMLGIDLGPAVSRHARHVWAQTANCESWTQLFLDAGSITRTQLPVDPFRASRGYPHSGNPFPQPRPSLLRSLQYMPNVRDRRPSVLMSPHLARPFEDAIQETALDPPQRRFDALHRSFPIPASSTKCPLRTLSFPFHTIFSALRRPARQTTGAKGRPYVPGQPTTQHCISPNIRIPTPPHKDQPASGVIARTRRGSGNRAKGVAPGFIRSQLSEPLDNGPIAEVSRNRVVLDRAMQRTILAVAHASRASSELGVSIASCGIGCRIPS
jgi:hypothetical protein